MATPSPTQKRFIDSVRPEPSKTGEAMRERHRTRKARKALAYVAIELLSALDERNISRKELAQHMAVSPEVVNGWLKGQTAIDEEMIAKLEEWLGVNAEEN